MKVQYCYFGLIDTSGQKTLIEHLKRINNILLKSNLTGVFYYAHQSFFCCLEGDFEKILKIKTKLNANHLFEQCYIISNHIVVLPQYKQWSMHYVHQHSNIMQFFNAEGYKYFQPFELSLNKRKFLVNLILNENEAPIQKKYNKGYKYRGAPFY